MKRILGDPRIRALFDGVSDAIFFLQGADRIVDCNRAAADIFGYGVEELIACPPAELLPPDRVRSYLWRFGRFLAAAAPSAVHRERIHALRGDGVRIELDVRLQHTEWTGPGGEPVVQVIARDLTALRAKDRNMAVEKQTTGAILDLLQAVSFELRLDATGALRLHRSDGDARRTLGMSMEALLADGDPGGGAASGFGSIHAMREQHLRTTSRFEAAYELPGEAGGKGRWVREVSRAERDPFSGILHGVHGVVQVADEEASNRQQLGVLRGIVEQLPTPLLVTDRSLGLHYANRAARNRLGMTAAQFGRLYLGEIVSRRDLDALRRLATAESDADDAIHVRLKHHMAKIGMGEVAIRRFRLQAPELMAGDRVVLVVEPAAADRPGLAASLAGAGGQLLETFLEISPGAVAITDAEGATIFANHEFLRAYGLTANEIHGLELGSDRFDPVDAHGRPLAPEERPVQRVRQSLEPVRNCIVGDRGRDGERRYWTVNVTPVLNHRGKLDRTIYTGFEISDLQSATRRLERELALRQRVLAANPAGIMVVDRAGRVLFGNRRAAALIGCALPADDTGSGRDVQWRFADLSGRPLVGEQLPFVRVFASGEPIERATYLFAPPDGPARTVQVHCAPLFDDHSESEKVYLQMLDVSREFAARRELEEANRRLSELATDLERVRFAERNELAHLLHDVLGQDLATLKLLLERAIAAGEQRDRAIGILDRAIELMRRIASGLADFDPERADLREAIQDLLSKVEREHALDTFLAFDDCSGGRLEGELSRLVFRIVREGVRNTVKHAAAEMVEVNVRCTGPWIRVMVRDDGRGVAAPLSDASPGFGLKLLRQEVHRAGGVFHLSGRRRGGTLLFTRIPLQRTAAEVLVG